MFPFFPQQFPKTDNIMVEEDENIMDKLEI